MKILYFGTICDLESYDRLLKDCTSKPSVAPIVFEGSLLTGLKENNIEADIYSFPMIPTFPSFNKIYWGSKKEILSCGYECTWLKTLNIPILKQLSRRIDGCRVIKKWLKKNRGQELVVLSYSMPPFLVKDITRLSRKYGAKCVALVTDLLRDMYVNSKDSAPIKALKNAYIKRAVAYQDRYDGYVYLTESMKEVISSKKPYMVMEAIAPVAEADLSSRCEKASPNAIMYAGMLEEKYGIIKLIDAFELSTLTGEELWLFGSGNAVDEIKKRAERNPRIKYFGRKSHDEVLKYEKAAALLVNPRNTDDSFTKYSFPSKTIEYMMSATPMLTTRLEGIPSEYYEYMFVCENNEPVTLCAAMENAMRTSQNERAELGARAKKFIKEEKNAKRQANRLVGFLSEVLRT